MNSRCRLHLGKLTNIWIFSRIAGGCQSNLYLHARFCAAQRCRGCRHRGTPNHATIQENDSRLPQSLLGAFSCLRESGIRQIRLLDDSPRDEGESGALLHTNGLDGVRKFLRVYGLRLPRRHFSLKIWPENSDSFVVKPSRHCHAPNRHRRKFPSSSNLKKSDRCWIWGREYIGDYVTCSMVFIQKERLGIRHYCFWK